MKDKIAAVMYECYQNGVNKKQVPRGYYAEKILSLFKNIRVEVACPICVKWKDLGGLGKPCKKCRDTGTILRPATPEEMEKGGVLEVKKENKT